MSDTYPQPSARDPRRPFVAAPFTRLARTHAFSVAGDALFTVGLAGSVFFAVPLGQARPVLAANHVQRSARDHEQQAARGGRRDTRLEHRAPGYARRP